MIRILDGKEVKMTELEIQQLEQSRTSARSKDTHLAEINALHEAEYKRRLEAANYVNGWEVVACAADPLNEYNAEAKTLLAYWFDGWSAIETYAANLTEQPTETPEEFVATL